MNISFTDWLTTVCDGIDLSAYLDVELAAQLTLSNDSLPSLLCDLYEELNEMEKLLAENPGAKITLKQLGRIFVFFTFVQDLTEEQTSELELKVKTVQQLRENMVQ